MGDHRVLAAHSDFMRGVLAKRNGLCLRARCCEQVEIDAVVVVGARHAIGDNALHFGNARPKRISSLLAHGGLLENARKLWVLEVDVVVGLHPAMTSRALDDGAVAKLDSPAGLLAIL